MPICTASFRRHGLRSAERRSGDCRAANRPHPPGDPSGATGRVPGQRYRAQPHRLGADRADQDAENRYIIGSPQNGTTPTLWRLPVVETQAITQDEFLTGAFSLGAQIFDRMDIEVLVSTENDKDFENNMVTIRAEERLAFAVYRPEAFVTGSLTAS